MKILMLTPYLPYPLLSGGQIRTYNLLKKLSKKHEITLFALIKDDEEKQYIGELEKYCSKVRVFYRSKKPFTLKNIFTALFSTYPFLVIRNHAPEALAAIKTEIAKEQYDLIHAETFYMMPHLPETKIPTILVEQTIEYLGYESYAKKAPFWLRALLNSDIKKIKKWEKHYWEKCDRLIVMSDDDKDFIARAVKKPNKIEVVANGVDSTWFDEKPMQLPDAPTLLFVGTFNWLPNVEAVKFLVEKVWPKILAKLPNAVLKIVGNNPNQAILNLASTENHINVLGRIPDIRDAFKTSHLLMAPVFSGKGTRYKILEAMAAGTPVVASKIAVEGLSVNASVPVLTDNSAEGMADLAVKVLCDAKLWQDLSENGHQFVAKYYNWHVIADRLDHVYQEIGQTQPN